MKRLYVILTLCCIVFSPVIGSALDFKPGLYELTSTVQMPGMALPAQTFTQCMTDQDPVPKQSSDSQPCEVINMDTDGNTITWEMECNQQGQSVKSSGEMTYSGNQFSGTVTTVTGPQAGNMTIITTISGKRIGDCN